MRFNRNFQRPMRRPMNGFQPRLTHKMSWSEYITYLFKRWTAKIWGMLKKSSWYFSSMVIVLGIPFAVMMYFEQETLMNSNM